MQCRECPKVPSPYLHSLCPLDPGSVLSNPSFFTISYQRAFSRPFRPCCTLSSPPPKDPSSSLPLPTPPLPLVLGLRETLSCWSSATQRRPPGTEVDVLPVCLIVSSMQIVHTIPAVTHMDVPTMSVRVYVPYFSLSHSRPCMLPDRPPVLHVVSKSHRSDPLVCAGPQS